ncbi:BZ3500_MvSof-1268-A1-R1_Chr9g10686 [Microbotryum saponariae]|uniref:BZ3500_MvSof-1268-A1-R1_Chr9g10686 protein n=1 Tax=Microbotryum saponariae TaxID=289078 RepID=A0A2X0L1T7_9BASI|nr:BZ3501_MvSof-1269-A2-R1_Chr9g10434 [Microbotryum saponariae]SDA00521.1 BZ3500_MvSof-1268-A1-R1_Chr9g10686 [Microbotryum saponariae]
MYQPTTKRVAFCSRCDQCRILRISRGAVRSQLSRSQSQGPHRSSTRRGARVRESTLASFHILAPGPDTEVTTDFRQWNIVSRRGKISTKRKSSQMQAIDMRLITRTSSTFTYRTSNQAQGPGCGREGQARHDLWPLQKARTQPSYMR